MSNLSGTKVKIYKIQYKNITYRKKKTKINKNIYKLKWTAT